MLKLFVFYLGGRAKGCKLEAHDVAFCVGHSVEDCYPSIKAQWYGDETGLHMDAFAELSIADGYHIKVLPKAHTVQEPCLLDSPKLYFINLGGYNPKHFTEYHPSGFFVASNLTDAKHREKTELNRSLSSLHVDDAFEVDDCLEVCQYLPNHFLALSPHPTPHPVITYTCGFNRVP